MAAHMFNHALAMCWAVSPCICLACHYRDLRLDQFAGGSYHAAHRGRVRGLRFQPIGIPGTRRFHQQQVGFDRRRTGAGTPPPFVLVAIILASRWMALVYIRRVVETSTSGPP